MSHGALNRLTRNHRQGIVGHDGCGPRRWLGVTRFFTRTAAFLVFGLILLVAGASHVRAADNELTDQEKRDGWLLLFDGKTTKGWMTTKKEPLPQKYVDEGALNPHPCDYMLTHEKIWDNFQLVLDFKITRGCNSGIFFRTFPLTPRPGKDVGFNGIEVAIDGTLGVGYHDPGALYDLVRPAKQAMKPIGEWNHVVLTVNDNLIDVEMNGVKVSHMDLDEWTEPNKRPDGTRHKFDIAYKDHPRKGYIGLQDHGKPCWFKNIKLKPLGSKPQNGGKVKTE